MAGSSYATASRRKILEYLKNSNDHTVTAADVDEYLKQHDSEVNITTIYLSVCRAGTWMRTAPASEMCEMWKDYSSGMSFYGGDFSSYRRKSWIYIAV